jgi:hypothetical protein
LTFKCDPLVILDRPESDLLMVQAVLEAGQALLKQANEEANRGR